MKYHFNLKQLHITGRCKIALIVLAKAGYTDVYMYQDIYTQLFAFRVARTCSNGVVLCAYVGTDGSTSFENPPILTKEAA